MSIWLVVPAAIIWHVAVWACGFAAGHSTGYAKGRSDELAKFHSSFRRAQGYADRIRNQETRQ